MEKARRILEQNYADEDFSLPHLCQKMRMSRSQLYRKLKALTGLSPSDFIRRYRLEKAKELLENEDLTVSEAAWRAGYKDASHFSNSFLATFGFRPGGGKNE